MPDNVDIERLFKTENSSRDKFLSRLFGIFNEEFVRIWCRDSRSPYADIGRPTIYSNRSTRGSTLDFCFEHKDSRRRFVAEMKCEMQRQDYKYLVLRESSQLRKHLKKNAFDDFLKVTRKPRYSLVKVGGKEIDVHGGVLVWGKVSESGKVDVMKEYEFDDVLSLETILADLNTWNNAEFLEMIRIKSDWCKHLFEGLVTKMDSP